MISNSENILSEPQLNPTLQLVDYKPFEVSGITLKMETKEENEKA